MAKSEDIFGCQNSGGTIGIQQVGVKDAAKHPAMYRAALPTTKNYLADNVTSDLISCNK